MMWYDFVKQREISLDILPVSSFDPHSFRQHCQQNLSSNPSTAACHLPSVQWSGELKGIRSEVNVSQENTMPNYACCRGADRHDDLINSVKTSLICDNLKPPYKSSNSQREWERRGDEMIKGGDGFLMYRQHLPTSHSNISSALRCPDSTQTVITFNWCAQKCTL